MTKDGRRREYTPWIYNDRRIGFIRSGTFHIQRSIAGRNIRISTGCVDREAAEAEYRKFELSPVGYVSRLGRSAFKRKPRGRSAILQSALGRAEGRISRAGKLYGVPPERIAQMRAEQDDCCAICARSSFELGEALEVDHCHATGRVRALLCGPCNRGLGHFEDSADRMRLAIRYLAEHRPQVGSNAGSHCTESEATKGAQD